MTRRPSGALACAWGLAVAGLLGAAACKPSASSAPARLPAGDAIWFEDGVATAADETEALATRGGCASVFLPAARLAAEGAHWTHHEAQPPAQPFQKLPVSLVVSVEGEPSAALASPAAVGPFSDAVALAVQAAVRIGPRFGRVRGVHLDIPFAAAQSEAYAAVIRNVRSKLSKDMLLTWSLRFTPGEAEREKVRAVADAADGAVAFIFGESTGADPVATDQLERPWLAAFVPAARGRAGEGDSSRRLPESVLAQLTNDPRVEFAHDLSLKEESASGFLLTPHEEISVGPYSFRPGERIFFRQPSLSDMVYRFGADLAGRRFVRGRTVVLSGRSEAERIFTLAALDEIILGHPLNADLRVTVAPSKAAVEISAENPTPNASIVSRTSNWVEVDLPMGGITDVRAGGFDRFEVFGPNGEPVTLGLATRVRFFETLISPGEKIAPARILVRRPPPKDCCSHRIHVLSSAGAELTREGDAATTPAPGTPTPR